MQRSFHIAEWEIQPEINSVKRGAESFHLEPKVMQVLVQLATHPNQVLSKEELIRKVWVDTFVGDDVLTRSISEIRRVFEDDPRSPRYIQTIPKSGYRMIAPVSFGQVTAQPVVPSPQETDPTPALEKPAETTHKPLPAIRPAHIARGKWVAVMVAAMIMAVVSIVFLGRKQPVSSEPSYRTVPFTSNIGEETQPAFSPDGKQIAFVWDSGNRGFRHIFVKIIGTESQLQLTSGDADDYSPVWSPDGTAIAFLRQSRSGPGIYIVPAIGGPLRKVYTPSGKTDVTVEWERGALSWSPDGQRLIFTDGKSSVTRSSIHSLDLKTMQASQITFPSDLVDGDFSPAFSPDGSKIAFVRGSEGFVRDIYIMDARGGEPSRLTFDNRYVSSVAWSSDGRSIVFSSDRGGKFGLWRVSLKGGDPERLSVGGEDAFGPAVSPAGGYLAYTQRSSKWGILRIALTGTRAEVSRVLASTQQDSAPQYSPDGSRIAFQSWRSGTQEIWVSSSDGTDLVKLTSFGGPLTGSPSWSPDGQRIAFDSRPEGHSHIYIVDLATGIPKAITDETFNDILPTWSHDGRWIYFGSNRSGGFGIWKVQSDGGEPKLVSPHGGFLALESPDRKWIYYTKGDAPGIWRVPSGGGAETMVLKQPAVGYWGYWTISGDLIYYFDSADSPPYINSYNWKTGQSVRIHSLERMPPPFAGITVSPDHKWLLYADLSESGSHITLVENFR